MVIENDEEELEKLFEDSSEGESVNAASVQPRLPSPQPQSQSKSPYRGSMLALLSAFFLAMSNVFIRKTELFSATEQTCIRYALQLVVMLSIAFCVRVNVFGSKDERALLVLRGVFGVLNLTALHVSVKYIDPSDAVAILHMNVIVVAVMARLTLNEKFSYLHVFSLLIAILGVFFIAQPSFLFKDTHTLSSNSTNFSTVESHSLRLGRASTLIGVTFALCATLSSSLIIILLKKLTNHHVHYSVVIVYASYFGLPFTGALSLIAALTNNRVTGNYSNLSQTLTTWQQCVYSFTSAACGVVAQLFMNLALKYEDASKVAIIRTTDLFFTFFLQIVFLNILSNLVSIAGALLIFLATILIMLYKQADQKWNRADGNQNVSTWKRIMFFKF